MAPEPAVETSRRASLLLGTIAIVALVVSISVIGSNRDVSEKSVAQEDVHAATVEIPAYTPEVAARIAKSNGFQALASYTDRGFEPSVLSITQGQTIRFTNNSRDDMWIVPSGNAYPGSAEGCGEGDLDSCLAITPMDFWEFTFDRSGEWSVRNKLVPEHTLVVKVE